MTSFLQAFMPGRILRYNDVVGLDLGTTATRVVRLRRIGGALTLVAADLLPPVNLPDAEDGGAAPPAPLLLPKALRGVHAAIALGTPHASIRLVTVSGAQEKVGSLNYPELLGIAEDANYRIGFEPLSAEARGEQLVLAAGVPDVDSRWAVALLPGGLPAPCSLQIAAIASLNGFSHDLNRRMGDAAGVLLVQIGAEVSNIAGFHKGRLVLFRQSPVGSQMIVKGVHERFGIEPDLVPGILEDGMIDASEIAARTIEPFLRQLLLAREYVERKRSCRVDQVFLCGLLVGARQWCSQIELDMGIRTAVWNPLAMLPAAPNALAPRVAGSECRFDAAIGAALAIMENGDDLPH